MSVDAKIYRKKACQEVFRVPQDFVHVFFQLSNVISLEINDVILTWTKFCPYENPNSIGVIHPKPGVICNFIGKKSGHENNKRQ
jgi:hypothetical protein